MRTGLVAIGLILVAALSVEGQTPTSHGLDLRVMAVTGAQTVLTDPQTGADTTVQAGDVVNGWTVVAITETGVELEHEDEEAGIVKRARLPVPPPSPTPSSAR